jgi:hypothetical protein
MAVSFSGLLSGATVSPGYLANLEIEGLHDLRGAPVGFGAKAHIVPAIEVHLQAVVLARFLRSDQLH